jgi:hypothetical protein
VKNRPDPVQNLKQLHQHSLGSYQASQGSLCKVDINTIFKMLHGIKVLFKNIDIIAIIPFIGTNLDLKDDKMISFLRF